MDSERTISTTVSTQIRLAEDTYEYVSKESRRLAISMNAVMNTMLDESRRYREAVTIIQKQLE